MITYVSTRGEAGERSFEDVLLAGLAEDGGLFVPTSVPALTPAEIRALRPLSYPELTARLLAPFTAGCFTEAELLALARDAYAGFTHPAIAPLRQLDRDSWMLELFHGPTLAFKDFAMQLLARMFDAVLQRRGERVTIVGATSGDTGAAAVRAFAGMRQVELAMLHPHGRVSPVQRRQMTTETAENVLNLAVDGTFDDCQDLVKAMFADQRFRDEMRLSGVNSINWARVVAQSVYYVWAGLRLGAPDRSIAFCVPTGNFGNVYAGWIASRMGLPIERLIVATNANDILARFFASGTYARGTVVATQSPSMDIQVASNFERLLLTMEADSPERVRARMQGFRQSGELRVEPDAFTRARQLFSGGTAGEAETAATIARTKRMTGDVVDPHTAVGLAVAERETIPPGVAAVTLSTAHPAKFPEAVHAACGVTPALPPSMADLMDRPEHVTPMTNDLGAVERSIRKRFGAVA
ncbi:MAG: threonine synthase [Geminicoccaceae bacterium]